MQYSVVLYGMIRKQMSICFDFVLFTQTLFVANVCHSKIGTVQTHYCRANQK